MPLIEENPDHSAAFYDMVFPFQNLFLMR